MSVIMDLVRPNERDTRGSQDSYETGRNCQDIKQDDSGRWWVHATHYEAYQIPDHNIRVIYTKRDTKADEAAPLPPYAKQHESGFQCATCKRLFPTLQGLKIHHGREHLSK